MPMNRKHKRQNAQGAEAGFTLIELVIVIALAAILNIFIFSIITKSLASQINMQERKERSDKAVLALERIGRELREARYIDYADNNELRFEKKITSSTDLNPWIRYARDTSTNILWRQSADLLANLPSDSTPGNVVAENVTVFSCSKQSNYLSPLEAIVINLTCDDPNDNDDGSVWKTKVFPRNYGL
jgi:prepilin-type N-terminal cleavage/methylation domain-containing protein